MKPRPTRNGDLKAKGLSFEQRVETVLWGEKELGVVGLMDQVGELRALARRNFLANAVIVVAVALHFTGADEVAKAILFKFIGLGP